MRARWGDKQQGDKQQGDKQQGEEHATEPGDPAGDADADLALLRRLLATR